MLTFCFIFPKESPNLFADSVAVYLQHRRDFIVARGLDSSNRKAMKGEGETSTVLQQPLPMSIISISKCVGVSKYYN